MIGDQDLGTIFSVWHRSVGLAVCSNNISAMESQDYEINNSLISPLLSLSPSSLSQHKKRGRDSPILNPEIIEIEENTKETRIETKRGRPHSEIWNYFNTNGRHETPSICMHCQVKTAHGMKRARVAEHLKECSAFQMAMKRLVESGSQLPSFVDWDINSEAKSLSQSKSTTTHRKSKGQKKNSFEQNKSIENKIEGEDFLQNLVWIHLENNLWWPGLIQSHSSRFQARESSTARAISLLGTQDILAADVTNPSEIIRLDSQNETIFCDLYSDQIIPDDFKQEYSEGLRLFKTYCQSKTEKNPLPIELNENIEATEIIAGTSLSLKRQNALTWEDYFIAVAFLSAMRSKDPSTQVGACIVNNRNRIVGIGYNGFPRGCSDDILPWARVAESELDTKYPYVCHAEVNAILNKNTADLDQCTLYVALFPCNECAKMIIQSGIQRVIYLSDKYHNTNSMRASRRMFDLAGVEYRQYQPKTTSILIDFASIEPNNLYLV